MKINKFKPDKKWLIENGFKDNGCAPLTAYVLFIPELQIELEYEDNGEVSGRWTMWNIHNREYEWKSIICELYFNDEVDYNNFMRIIGYNNE